MIGADRLQPVPPSRRQRRHSWMNVPFMVNADAPRSLEQVKAGLEAHGVDTRPIIAGNLLHHPAARFGPTRSVAETPVADTVLRRGFMIGCHPQRSEESIATLHRALAALAD
jgi:CDP-6-deoxy-D-xylo-4-hexulose-3-dehydrase